MGSAELERSVLSRGEDVWREGVKPGATLVTAERSVPRPLAGSRWWVIPPPPPPRAMRNRTGRKNHTGRDCLEGGNYPAPERYPNETEE